MPFLFSFMIGDARADFDRIYKDSLQKDTDFYEENR